MCSQLAIGKDVQRNFALLLSSVPGALDHIKQIRQSDLNLFVTKVNSDKWEPQTLFLHLN